jgi:SAM-dependent methyltransferase
MPVNVPPASRAPHARAIRRRTARRDARLVAAAIRAGRSSANDAFDRFLPDDLRSVSPHYWTPIQVVGRAAVWLRETRVRSVIDIGSGAGKFCVAAALLTRCRITGLEHRDSLVSAARDLARAFDVDDRVTFTHGDLSTAAGLSGDCYYFFNPFGDYTFDSPRFAEPDVVFNHETQRRDMEAVAALLSRAPAGTFVITYNGYGGTIPPGYEQIDVAARLPGTLRLWKKHEEAPAGPHGERTKSGWRRVSSNPT